MPERNIFTSLGLPAEMANVADADAHSPETSETASVLNMGDPPVPLSIGQIDDGQLVIRDGSELVGIAAGVATSIQEGNGSGDVLTVGDVANQDLLSRDGSSIVGLAVQTLFEGFGPTSITESSGPTTLPIGGIPEGSVLIRSGDLIQGVPYVTPRQTFVGAAYGEQISNTFACHIFPPAFNFSGLDPQPEPLPMLFPFAGNLKTWRLRYHVPGGGTGMAIYIFLNGSLDGSPLNVPDGGGSETTFTDLVRVVTVSVDDRVRIVFSGSTTGGGPARATLSFVYET